VKSVDTVVGIYQVNISGCLSTGSFIQKIGGTVMNSRVRFVCLFFAALFFGFISALWAGEAIVLENSVLRLTFNSDTGALTGMKNKKTGSEYIQKPSQNAPFILDVYSANQSYYINDYSLREYGGHPLAHPDSLKYYPGDLSYLRGEGEKPKIKVVTEIGGGKTLVCTYSAPPAFTVTTTVSLEKDSHITKWKIKVQNAPAKHPIDDLRLFKVAFPVLEGLALRGDHRDDFLARPFLQGQLIPDPVNYSFERPHHRTSRVHNNSMSYVGFATMPWQCLYDEGGGLYLASYDPTFEQIDMESFPDREQGTLTMNVRTFAYRVPGQSWDSQMFVVGIHDGDWHWAADTYRVASKAWLHTGSRPEWVKYSDGWLGTGGPNYRFEDLVDMYEQAKWLGLNYIQVWSQMLEPKSPDGTRKGYYCFFLPDPDRGGEKELTEAVRKIRSDGGHVGFYYNSWTFDAEISQTLNRVRDKIPPSFQIPDWWEGFRSYASVFPDGSRKAGDYISRKKSPEDVHGEDMYTGMCPAAEGWQDYLTFWVVDKYVREYGVDTCYLDCFPTGMLGGARICFSTEHGDDHPHGVIRGSLAMLKKLKNSSYGTVNLAITSEAVSDACMQYQSHALGLELTSGMDYNKPEIYAYTFPEFPIFSGTCNGSTAQHYYPGEKVTREDTMNRVFLMGNRFDILGYPLEKNRPFWQYMKKLIALRQAIKGELYNSHFRDENGLGNLPPKVEAKIFRHVDKTSLTINFIDRRKTKSSFTLEVDPQKHGVKSLKECYLYTFEGKKKIKARKSRGLLNITVPQRKDNVAAIIIKQ